MWGDPEKALQLQPSDPLSTILFQVTGPAHIPWQDSRWQELLHGYNIWMHVELRHGSVIEQASNSLLQHAPRSSNLAAFSMHMTRMLRDLRLPSSAGTEQQSAVADFSNRIAMVGKARATAGSLNLFRLLVHAAIVRASSSACESESSSSSDYVKEAFTYKNRDSNTQNDTANDFVRALMEFIIISSSDDGNNKVPELYDATVLALQVVLILLSSQLYTPMISSFQRNQQSPTVRFFWDTLFQQASQSASENNWKPRSLLKALLDNSINRPAAPERSITFHNSELAKQVVQAKGEKLGEDGMYDSHVVISACAPMHLETNPETGSDELVKNGPTQRHNIIFDATKGVLRISSSIILLPFRLVSLVLGVWGNREKGYDNLHRKQICASLAQGQSLTKDVLWLTESPVADLSSCLLLLLSNNERNTLNPFRDELAHLTDNRWESDDHGLPDLPDLKWGTSALTDKQNDETAPLFVQLNTTLDQSLDTDKIVLQVNFEALFEAFGKIVHNEVGALLLYTIMQSSRSFADAIAVRSDLDTLVLPLLRTLYMSSSLRHFAAVDFSTRAKGRPTNGVVNSSEVHEAMSIRSCPFRSQSQLYTIMILLLLFSQDNSFGSDAFRRVMVANVPWYKERYLKEISLGSVLLLSLLRALTFNLNRLQDAFLLSNSCAILMNLSASVSDLHEYAAMRLASVTVSSIKRYVEFSKMNPNIDEDDLSSPTAMHGEVCRTLVRVVKECLSSKSIERNMHLVYALVYHQAEFMRAIKSQDSPFKKGAISRIQKVIETASSVIEQGDARTAAKALKVLSENMDQIRDAVSERKKRTDVDAFTFTYEEEADPEIFFVPYVWEVIVCCATASSIEWDKRKIQVFPLLEDPNNPLDESIHDVSGNNAAQLSDYSKDVSDVV